MPQKGDVPGLKRPLKPYVLRTNLPDDKLLAKELSACCL